MPALETSVLLLAVIVIGGYLIGSIPFGLLVSKLFRLPDPRGYGSKNIGATNVLRSGSKIAALTTVLLDAGKGVAAVLFANMIAGADGAQVAGLAAFVGHAYPIWLGFKGGKGVATLFGVIVTMSPLIGFLALCAWLFTFFVFRYSSLSALMAAIVTPPIAMFTGNQDMLAMLIVMAAMLFWTHRANIKRLVEGSEPMVNLKKK